MQRSKINHRSLSNIKDPGKYLEVAKMLDRVEDLSLSHENRIQLISAIPLRQLERWRLLRNFHSMGHVSIAARHALMKNIIQLMREQNERLRRLKAFVRYESDE